ncbi:MAG TPA: hypothetical protein VFW71_11790 [Actinomycetota bacterium]|nr:hypothetical protein [Actinomycetota bacterium]
MARITSVVVPLASAAQSLTLEIRSILDLHTQEIGQRREEVVTHLDAALDALDELVDVLERS